MNASALESGSAIGKGSEEVVGRDSITAVLQGPSAM